MSLKELEAARKSPSTFTPLLAFVFIDPDFLQAVMGEMLAILPKLSLTTSASI